MCGFASVKTTCEFRRSSVNSSMKVKTFWCDIFKNEMFLLLKVSLNGVQRPTSATLEMSITIIPWARKSFSTPQSRRAKYRHLLQVKPFPSPNISWGKKGMMVVLHYREQPCQSGQMWGEKWGGVVVCWGGVPPPFFNSTTGKPAMFTQPPKVPLSAHPSERQKCLCVQWEGWNQILPCCFSLFTPRELSTSEPFSSQIPWGISLTCLWRKPGPLFLDGRGFICSTTAHPAWVFIPCFILWCGQHDCKAGVKLNGQHIAPTCSSQPLPMPGLPQGWCLMSSFPPLFFF